MNAPLTHELLAAPAAIQRYAVKITFTDGVYENFATTMSEKRAIDLALTDARMGSPFGTFMGAVLSSSAEPA